MAESTSAQGVQSEQDAAAARPLLDRGSTSFHPDYQAIQNEDYASENSGLAASGRRHSLGENRQAFQAARQDDVRRAMLHRGTLGSPMGCVMMLLGFILLVVPVVFMLYIEIMSWNVLFVFGDKPCDQNLAAWLLIRNIMSLTAPRLPAPDETDFELAERQRARARLGATLYTAWLIVGYIWVQSCKSCQHTNPQMYEWVRFLTVFGLLVHFMMTFFPILFVLIAMAYHGMVARGWIKSPNAASDDAIERLEKVEYSPAVFRERAEPDGGPPADCCCCMEAFNSSKVIIVTPCRHYFHYDCLKEWLKLSKTCPLCRSDLDIQEP